jgi:preprotein translocase subunit SecY
MVISRGRNPSAAEILSQLIQAKGLRDRVLITLGLLLIVRLGIYVPVPGIDRVAFQAFIQRGGQLLGFLDIFTGGGLSTVGVFALGILPFINASIILQLLTAALPQLEDLQKNEGEAGRRKIAQITRYVALGWGIVQSTVFALILKQYALPGLPDWLFVAQTALALVTGSMVVMWISEVITERGIGQMHMAVSKNVHARYRAPTRSTFREPLPAAASLPALTARLVESEVERGYFDSIQMSNGPAT